MVVARGINIETRNQMMMDAFHAAGHKGSGVVIGIGGSGVNPVGILAGNVIAGNDYALIDYNEHDTAMAWLYRVWLPLAQLISYQVFPLGKPSIAALKAAMRDFLARAKADRTRLYIFNLSLSGDDLDDEEIKDLTRQMIAARIALPCSAGNTGGDASGISHPGATAWVTTVTYLTRSGRPGKDASSIDTADHGDYGTDVPVMLASGKMGTMSGASVATAIVGCKMGLIQSCYHDQTGQWWEMDQQERELQLRSIDIIDEGWDAASGYGVILCEPTVYDVAPPATTPEPEPEQGTDDPALKLTVPWMRGDAVRKLQTLLVAHGYPCGGIDGIFGEATEAALKRFQAAKGLTVSGITDEATWAALYATPDVGSSALDQFIAYLWVQVNNGSIYVWGAQGQTGSAITEAWIRAKETSAANADRAIAFWRKQLAAGYKDLHAYDCSGLGMYFIQNLTGLSATDKTANGMMRICTMITRTELRRGDWAFRLKADGTAYHIGYVVDDKLTVIEAMGRDVGVVARHVDAKDSDGDPYWHAFGRPSIFAAEIPLPVEPQPEPEPEPAPAGESIFAICAGASVNVRSGPGTEYDVVTVAHKGDKFTAVLTPNGWYWITGFVGGQPVTGYMSGKYIEEA
jgi:hypothetical protein